MIGTAAKSINLVNQDTSIGLFVLMNIYIHIPFCASICNYCDFTSFVGQDYKMAPYVDVLCREIGASTLEGPLRTLYFGGGTPSTLPVPLLEKLLSRIKAKVLFNPDIEISLEANPETVDLPKLAGYRFLGVNRLSFGAQAFQRELLKELGRGHDWNQVELSFHDARTAGFENINLDLMFGLPGQTLEMFKKSVEKAVGLGPDHLSLYALQVEEGTPLFKKVKRGLALPSEDETADRYAFAQEFLARQGFEQYEVSNFARAGKHCRHNWNIWRGEDYRGFGVSAVGTVKNTRYSHGDNLEEYLENEGKGPSLHLEKLSKSILAFEKIMLGLRTRDGVLKEDVERYADSRGISYKDKFAAFLREGLLSLTQGRYRVTPKGFFVLNGVLEALMA